MECTHLDEELPSLQALCVLLTTCARLTFHVPGLESQRGRRGGIIPPIRVARARESLISCTVDYEPSGVEVQKKDCRNIEAVAVVVNCRTSVVVDAGQNELM